MQFYGIRRNFFVAGLLSLFFNGAACAYTIQGEIDHKEYVAPVSQEFKAGATFAAPSQVSHVKWFPVPNWLAGTWMKNGDMETYLKDFRTGEEIRKPMWLNNKVRLGFGHQLDSLGTIWHAEILPFRADGNRGNSTDRRYVMDMNCLNSNPQSVALKFHSNVIRVDPGSGTIQSTNQQEEIVTFRPDRDGLIATTSSTKNFDENGRPLLQAYSNAERTKIAEFVPVAQLNGIDLASSLIDFFTANNMTDRLAGQNQNSAPR
ncbi:MAG: hypothetical protein SGJ27_00805 [Candidatus Melainabacteria bacterium]|nr:hypothetical protein [Candidatus Melainabacteria bacterium]